MPRVKLIYVGDGEFIPPIANIRDCPHPRNKLRFDSRFSLPIYVYCTACGKPFLHPFHGMSDKEIQDHKDYVEKEFAWLFKDGSN